MDASTTEKPLVTWDELVGWAMENTDEGWGKIDAVIGSVADEPEHVLHAVADLSHENRNIRDLAASVLEATSVELADETIVLLKEMLGDEHFYAKFRAACALVKHRAYGDQREEVKAILQEACADEDDEIISIAQKYLGELETQLTSNS